MAAELTCAVRVREVGSKRHIGVAKDHLTNSWMHVVHMTRDHADEYARWLLEHNTGPDGFESAQVIDAFTRRVLRTYTR